MLVVHNHKTPTDSFEEFYLSWHPKVQIAVHQGGFYGPDADDLVEQIFADLLKGEYLQKFDVKKGSFTTYIWTQVKVRILDKKRFFGKRSGKEVPELDNVESDSVLDTGLLRAEYKQVVRAVHNDLSNSKSQNLAALFVDIVRMIEEKGAFSQAELARQRGVPRQTISWQVQRLAKTKAVSHLHEFRI